MAGRLWATILVAVAVESLVGSAGTTVLRSFLTLPLPPFSPMFDLLVLTSGIRPHVEVVVKDVWVDPVERNWTEVDLVLKPGNPLHARHHREAAESQDFCDCIVGCIVQNQGRFTLLVDHSGNYQTGKSFFSLCLAVVLSVVEALSERPPQLEVPSFDVIHVAYLVERNASLAKDLVLKAGIPEEDPDLPLLTTFGFFGSEILGGKPLDNRFQLFDALIAGEGRRPGQLAVIRSRLVRVSSLLLPVPAPECFVRHFCHALPFLYNQMDCGYRLCQTLENDIGCNVFCGGLNGGGTFAWVVDGHANFRHLVKLGSGLIVECFEVDGTQDNIVLCIILESL